MELLSYRAQLGTGGAFRLLPHTELPPATLLALLAAPTRQQIERLEDHLVQHDQVEIPVQHRFADGLYAREITIPADTLMTGKVHKHEHVSIMLSGDMTVLTEQGMRRVTGPQVFISSPGTKRVGYAHSETRWLTVHTNPDNETDPVQIEARLVEPWELAAVLAAQKEKACLS